MPAGDEARSARDTLDYQITWVPTKNGDPIGEATGKSPRVTRSYEEFTRSSDGASYEFLGPLAGNMEAQLGGWRALLQFIASCYSPRITHESLGLTTNHYESLVASY